MEKEMITGEAFHGSDIEKIEEVYGIPKEDIVSFSANVSPMGVSERYLQGITSKLDCVERYPDREYRALKKAISLYCGAKSENIIVGGGSTELIGAAIKQMESPRVIIVTPAYSEYERNVKQRGGTVEHFFLKEEDGFAPDISEICEALNESHDILIICNPVNPTSTAFTRDGMEAVLKRCEKCGIVCIVDETYIDFADERFDVTPLTDRFGCLFVIRSMSKFFCAPGLRLGYGITQGAELKERIEESKDPWSVSSLSNEAALLMLSDTDHIGRTRAYIKEERQRIMSLLDDMEPLGIRYYRPEANFVLVRLPEGGPTSGGLFERAVKEGMMIRDCADFPGLDDRYIRFCFMKKDDDDRLMSLIRKVYS